MMLDDDGGTLTMSDWSDDSSSSSSGGGGYFSTASGSSVSSSSSTSVSSKPDKKRKANPWATPQNQYADDAFDRLKLWFICDRLAKTTDSAVPNSPSYTSFVDLARAIQVHHPHPAQQRAAILSMLMGILPAWLLALYRTLFAPSRFSAELNAFMCTLVSHWLIGPSAVVTAEVTVPPSKQSSSSSSSMFVTGAVKSGRTAEPTVEQWRSAVKVERCRYLETSQCKGACMNLCKLPTEAFFAQELGMPLHMEPNFEDLSCTFTFGKSAPAPEDDPLLKEPCFKECPATAMLLATRPKPCHTMPEHAAVKAAAASADSDSEAAAAAR